MHPIVLLAREAIIEYVNNGSKISPPEDLPDETKKRAGVFISIKKAGMLRGCIGTFSPTQQNIAMEVIENAISAAVRDPRFTPVKPEELDDLDISVDVLSEPENVKDTYELDPKRYGVIVNSGLKRGLLLPDLEGVDTIEQQLEIVKRKVGIEAHEEIEIMKFKVNRYK